VSKLEVYSKSWRWAKRVTKRTGGISANGPGRRERQIRNSRIALARWAAASIAW
jgi:hypothetical protein